MSIMSPKNVVVLEMRIEISRKRIEEIFAIPEIQKIWDRIVKTTQYQFTKKKAEEMVKKTCAMVQVYDVEINAKKSIIIRAISIEIETDISFNEAIKKAATQYLEESERADEESITEALEKHYEKDMWSKVLCNADQMLVTIK